MHIRIKNNFGRSKPVLMVLIILMAALALQPFDAANAETCGGNDLKDTAGILDCKTGTKIHDLNIQHSGFDPTLSYVIITEKKLPKGESNMDYRMRLVNEKRAPDGSELPSNAIMIMFIPNDGKPKWSITPGSGVSDDIVKSISSDLFSNDDKKTIESSDANRAVSLMVDRLDDKIMKTVEFSVPINGKDGYKIENGNLSYGLANEDYISRSYAYAKEAKESRLKAEAQDKANKSDVKSYEAEKEASTAKINEIKSKLSGYALLLLVVVGIVILLSLVYNFFKMKISRGRLLRLDGILDDLKNDAVPGLDSDSEREKARNVIRKQLKDLGVRATDTDVESLVKKYYYDNVLPEVMKTSKYSTGDPDWYPDFLKQADDDDWAKWKIGSKLDVDAITNAANVWNKSGRLDHVELAKREHEIDSKFNKAWNNFKRNSPEVFATIGLSNSKLKRLMRASDEVDNVLKTGDESWKWMVDEWPKVKDDVTKIF